MSRHRILLLPLQQLDRAADSAPQWTRPREVALPLVSRWCAFGNRRKPESELLHPLAPQEDSAPPARADSAHDLSDKSVATTPTGAAKSVAMSSAVVFTCMDIPATHLSAVTASDDSDLVCARKWVFGAIQS